MVKSKHHRYCICEECRYPQKNADVQPCHPEKIEHIAKAHTPNRLISKLSEYREKIGQLESQVRSMRNCVNCVSNISICRGRPTKTNNHKNMYEECRATDLKYWKG